MKAKLNVKLLSHTLNPELTVATGGKLCYSASTIDELVEKQSDESVESFINRIFNMGHFSVMEHCTFTFGIEGVSRSLTHQLVRHRLASYSQQSQRYVNLEKGFKYIVPSEIEDTFIEEVFEEAMEESYDYYKRITKLLLEKYIHKFLALDKGIDIKSYSFEDMESYMKENYKKEYNAFTKKAIENARAVLPNACETKIVVTMNLRSLINFTRHRCCRRAQDEIHNLAWEMKEVISTVSPLLGKFLGATCQFGKCSEGAMSCGRPYPKK